MKRLPKDTFIRRASALIVSIAIQGQGENNASLKASIVWRSLQDIWQGYTLPKYSTKICEKICNEIMMYFPCADAEIMEYEGEEPYFDIVMYTEYTMKGTCGLEEY